MDPNYFSIDWERLGEVLITIIVFSFFLERALSPLFESRFFINRLKKKSLKEIIAVLSGFAICWIWHFDAISFVFPKESTSVIGYFITGAIIAGGSKASIKLFKDLLGVKSTAQAELEK
ncbi:MAG TPA: hypothetical protein PLV65_10395 [Tenuifilaceae bacterium]|jgi:hypothetical protein|nr:hypothetical protein [Tenuifilaceae bacterium]